LEEVKKEPEVKISLKELQDKSFEIGKLTAQCDQIKLLVENREGLIKKGGIEKAVMEHFEKENITLKLKYTELQKTMLMLEKDLLEINDNINKYFKQQTDIEVLNK
jgi:hypothetical protein